MELAELISQGILMILPGCHNGAHRTTVIDVKGQKRHFYKKSSKILLELAARKGYMLTILRKAQGNGRCWSKPIVLDEHHTFVPLRTRTADVKGDVTIGYINVTQLWQLTPVPSFHILLEEVPGEKNSTFIHIPCRSCGATEACTCPDSSKLHFDCEKVSLLGKLKVYHPIQVVFNKLKTGYSLYLEHRNKDNITRLTCKVE